MRSLGAIKSTKEFTWRHKEYEPWSNVAVQPIIIIVVSEVNNTIIVASIPTIPVADYCYWPGRCNSWCQWIGWLKLSMAQVVTIPLAVFPIGLADGKFSVSAHGIAGALSARPLSYESPKALQCFISNGLSTCFVSMSAGLSAPRTFTSLKSPFRMRSCIQRSAVARCLTLPRPLRLQMPMAAVASV